MNKHNLLEALRGALSADAAVRVPYEAALALFYNSPGLCVYVNSFVPRRVPEPKNQHDPTRSPLRPYS